MAPNWRLKVRASGNAVFHVPQTNLTMKATKQLQKAAQHKGRLFWPPMEQSKVKTLLFLRPPFLNTRPQFSYFQAEQKERLEAAHHHTVGQLAKVVEDKFSVNFSPPALAAVAKLSLHYIEEAATDIEAFAK